MDAYTQPCAIWQTLGNLWSIRPTPPPTPPPASYPAASAAAAAQWQSLLRPVTYRAVWPIINPRPPGSDFYQPGVRPPGGLCQPARRLAGLITWLPPVGRPGSPADCRSVTTGGERTPDNLSPTLPPSLPPTLPDRFHLSAWLSVCLSWFYLCPFSLSLSLCLTQAPTLTASVGKLLPARHKTLATCHARWLSGHACAHMPPLVYEPPSPPPQPPPPPEGGRGARPSPL